MPGASVATAIESQLLGQSPVGDSSCKVADQDVARVPLCCDRAGIYRGEDAPTFLPLRHPVAGVGSLD